MPEVNAEQVWQRVVELLRGEDVNPPVWNAVWAAQPVTIDENTFVLGFKPVDMHHASYLETSATRSIIHRLLKQAAGRDLQLRCIEGTTMEAWQRTKAREQAAVEHLTGAVRERTEIRTAQQRWEKLDQDVANVIRRTRTRGLALTNAKLLLETLPMIAETETAARRAAPQLSELHDRELNRIFDRLATSCSISATAVALEYLRVISRRQEKAEQ